MTHDGNEHSDTKTGGDGKRPSLFEMVFKRKLPLERETSWFILVSVLDILLTYLLLSRGDHRESNPIADFFISRWGTNGMVAFKFLLVAFVTVVAQVIATKSLNKARWVLNFGIVVVACVVVYSLTLLVRAGGLF